MANEIRFSNYSGDVDDEQKPENRVAPRPKKHLPLRKYFKWLGFLVLLLLVFYAASGYWSVVSSWGKNDSNSYYAVFLSNSQVYFGLMEKNTDNELVLKDVYYLQPFGEGQSLQNGSEQRFSLVKLGSELHGPTENLFLNKSHVLFYEKLRDDSKVVESIRKGK